MKKAIYTALSMFVLMICTPANAQTQPDTTRKVNTTQTQRDDQGRQSMKSSELPKAVQETFGGSDYSGWKMEETAYSVRREDDSIKHYEVTLKKTATGETKVVRIDSQGKVVK